MYLNMKMCFQKRTGQCLIPTCLCYRHLNMCFYSLTLLLFGGPATQLPDKSHGDLFFLMKVKPWLGLFLTSYSLLKLSRLPYAPRLLPFLFLYTFLKFLLRSLLCSWVAAPWSPPLLLSFVPQSFSPRFFLLFILSACSSAIFSPT